MSRIARHGKRNNDTALSEYMLEKQRSAENVNNTNNLNSAAKQLHTIGPIISNEYKKPKNKRVNGNIGRLEEMYAKLSRIEATNIQTKKNLLMKNQEIKNLRSEIEVLKGQLKHAHQKKAQNINFSQFVNKKPNRWCEGGPSCVVSGGKKHRRTKRKNRRIKRKNRRTKRKN